MQDKINVWTYVDTKHVRYCGGEMDFDTTVRCRYDENLPKPCEVTLNSEAHLSVQDFQLPFFECLGCKGKELFLSKFANKNLQPYGFGYSVVDMEYACPTCHL